MVLKGCRIKTIQLTEIMFILFYSVDNLIFYISFKDYICKMVDVSSNALLKAILGIFNHLSACSLGYNHKFLPDFLFKFFLGVWTMFKNFWWELMLWKLDAPTNTTRPLSTFSHHHRSNTGHLKPMCILYLTLYYIFPYYNYP